MIKPKKLEKNDVVALIAPPMSAKEEIINKAIKNIKLLGLIPYVYQSCYLRNDKEQVSASERAKDIMNAFIDHNIKGIIALKAGTGTLDVLDYLDYQVIKSHPKVFMGFSDITGMHLALNMYSSLITFYGPLATSNIRVKNQNETIIDPYTLKYIEKNLFSNKIIGKIENPKSEEVIILNNGKTKGQLIGGNLSLITKTLGTKYEIDTSNKILFIEDYGESLTSIINMLNQLKTAHKIDDCAGIIIGTWTNCSLECPDIDRVKIINESIFKMLSSYNKPILANIQSGHSIPMLTIPLGVEVEIDTTNLDINILESATE